MINRKVNQLHIVPEKYMPVALAAIDTIDSFENKTAGNYMALGAALGNHRELVDALLAKGASKDWAMQGTASANHEELTQALKLAEFKSHPVTHSHLFARSASFQRPLERRIETDAT